MTTPPPGATVADNATIASRIEKAMDGKDGKVSLLALAEETAIPYKTLHRSVKGGTTGFRPLNLPELGAISLVLGILPSKLIEVAPPNPGEGDGQ